MTTDVTPIMKPWYQANTWPDPSKLIFEGLMDLAWLDLTEARKEYFMSDVTRSYTYGKGDGERTYTSSPFAWPVTGIMRQLNGWRRLSEGDILPLRGHEYNVCFLNRYDNQRNHLGWHADDSPMMDRTHPIAVVSFGVEREIWWKLQSEKGLVPPENRQLLGNGSVFVMPAGFQDHYYHRIPKCDRECGTRISLTFRKYKEQT